MPRNVARLLPFSCAPSPRCTPIKPPHPRTYASTPAANDRPKPSPSAAKEQAIYALRIADQAALRSAKEQLNAFATSIAAVPTHAQTHHPTTLTDPNIRVPYTLGSLRTRVDALSLSAKNSILQIQNVHRHLSDLQEEAYRDMEAEDPALVAFAREMEGWSREEKEDRLQTWRWEREAKSKRMESNARELVTYVEQVLRKGKATSPRGRAKVGGGVEKAEEEDGRMEENVSTEGEESKGEEKEIAAATATAPEASEKEDSLQDLQRRLEAAVIQPKSS